MNQNAHDEACGLIALGGGLSDAQQEWLLTHLEQCAGCRHYAHLVNEVVCALRSVPMAADPRLVRATQMRVRFHENRLQQMRQRLWLIGLACLGVGLSASLTAPFLWRIFEWLGQWAGVSNVVWQAAFMLFFILPGLFVAVLLLGRVAQLRQNDERSSW
jgi:hypothetical protein